MDDAFGVGDDGGKPRAHARKRGGIKAELEHGFLDAVAPGLQRFSDAVPSFVIGDVVGDDVDHLQATPLHW